MAALGRPTVFLLYLVAIYLTGRCGCRPQSISCANARHRHSARELAQSNIMHMRLYNDHTATVRLAVARALRIWPTVNAVTPLTPLRRVCCRPNEWVTAHQRMLHHKLCIVVNTRSCAFGATFALDRGHPNNHAHPAYPHRPPFPLRETSSHILCGRPAAHNSA